MNHPIFYGGRKVVILRGESPERIKFLRNIIEAAPAQLKPIPLFTWMPFSALALNMNTIWAYLNDAQPRVLSLIFQKIRFIRSKLLTPGT